MNVSLTPELEKFVAEHVRSGRYASASEVIRDALRIMEDEDRLRDLRRDVQLGIEQLDRGQTREFDARTVARIKKRGTAQLRSSNHQKGRAR